MTILCSPYCRDLCWGTILREVYSSRLCYGRTWEQGSITIGGVLGHPFTVSGRETAMRDGCGEESLMWTHGAGAVKGLVVGSTALPGNSKAQCLRITAETKHWALSWWSAPAPGTACWLWGFAARCSLTLSYSGELKSMNNCTSGSLETTGHSTWEGDHPERSFVKSKRVWCGPGKVLNSQELEQWSAQWLVALPSLDRTSPIAWRSQQKQSTKSMADRVQQIQELAASHRHFLPSRVWDWVTWKPRNHGSGSLGAPCHSVMMIDSHERVLQKGRGSDLDTPRRSSSRELGQPRVWWWVATTSPISWGSLQKQHHSCGWQSAQHPGSICWFQVLAARWSWDLWAQASGIT
jgi:hypothetical protein